MSVRVYIYIYIEYTYTCFCVDRYVVCRWVHVKEPLPEDPWTKLMKVSGSNSHTSTGLWEQAPLRWVIRTLQVRWWLGSEHLQRAHHQEKCNKSKSMRFGFSRLCMCGKTYIHIGGEIYKLIDRLID